MATTQVTLLNSMAGKVFEDALSQHVSWGIKCLDLKDAIFGKGIVELTAAEAEHATELIRQKQLSVYCFSTGLFGGVVESGEETFRRDYLEKLAHVIKLAEILRPQLIRLLAAQTEKRWEIEDSVAYLRESQPWLIPLYAEAIDRLHDAGFQVTIENEVHNCILSNPEEINDFFDALNRPNSVCLTWDVQNLWQMGTYPTPEIYRQLKGLIGYYHLKGGQRDEEGGEVTSPLRWRSGLEDASWPIVEITRQVVTDGVSPVICLNPSHGQAKPGYNYDNITERDLAFIRQMIPEIE